MGTVPPWYGKFHRMLRGNLPYKCHKASLKFRWSNEGKIWNFRIPPTSVRTAPSCALPPVGTKMQNESQLKLTSSKVKIGNEIISIVLPESEDEVLDMHIREGKLDRDPYWCRLWPSAILMAQEIAKVPSLVSGKRVCDLGAGLGLPGLTASKFGASEVVLYDREPLALTCALVSAHLNFSPIRSNLPQFLPELSDFVSASQAPIKIPEVIPCNFDEDKFHDSNLEYLETPGTNNKIPTVEAQIFDWASKETSIPGYDVILACDVLYELPAVDLIADLVPRLINSQKGSKLVVTDPVERVPQNRERFVELMREKYSEGKGMKLIRMSKEQVSVDNFQYNVVFMVFEM